MWKFRLKPPSETIRGFWYGEPLEALQWACLRSFLRHGHRFELYAYQPLEVPDGVTLLDATDIVPRDQMFILENTHSNAKDVAPFTDYFRLEVLYHTGGWWCDVDTICLSQHLPAGNRVWARQAPEYRPDSVSNGQMYFQKGDWVASRLLEACKTAMADVERRESLGPELMSRVLPKLGLPLDMNASANEFYPLRYIEVFKLWLPEFLDEVTEKIERAIFLPVYQSFPQRIGLGYEKLPPKGSFLHQFIIQEAPEFSPNAHDANEFRAAVKSWLKKNSGWSIERLKSVSRPQILEWLQC